MPNVTVLGGEPFREWLVYEGSALMNEINVLIKVAQEQSHVPYAGSTCVFLSPLGL